jgi:hypothetical protein
MFMENSHISALHAKHDAIKDKIRVELSRPLPDTMRLAALKKQKLRLKEEMFHP